MILFVDFSLLSLIIHMPELVGLFIIIKDQGQNVLNLERLKCASVFLFYGLLVNFCGFGVSLYLFSRHNPNLSSVENMNLSIKAQHQDHFKNEGENIIILYLVVECLKIFLA